LLQESGAGSGGRELESAVVPPAEIAALPVESGMTVEQPAVVLSVENISEDDKTLAAAPTAGGAEQTLPGSGGLELERLRPFLPLYRLLWLKSRPLMAVWL